MRKLYKTIFTVEVLSEEPISRYMTLGDINHEITSGDFSGILTKGNSISIPSGKIIETIKNQGTDPEFFGFDEVITDEVINTFLETHGTKVKKNEKSDYVELMMDNHKCIEFNKKQYYIPEDTAYNELDEKIYDYLEENFHV